MVIIINDIIVAFVCRVIVTASPAFWAGLVASGAGKPLPFFLNLETEGAWDFQWLG